MNSKIKIVTIDGFDFQYRLDDYINLTKMCKQVNRNLSTYLRSKHYKDYISYMGDVQNFTVEYFNI